MWTSASGQNGPSVPSSLFLFTSFPFTCAWGPPGSPTRLLQLQHVQLVFFTHQQDASRRWTIAVRRRRLAPWHHAPDPPGRQSRPAVPLPRRPGDANPAREQCRAPAATRAGSAHPKPIQAARVRFFLRNGILMSRFSLPTSMAP
jgi:hypothetical protein